MLYISSNFTLPKTFSAIIVNNDLLKYYNNHDKLHFQTIFLTNAEEIPAIIILLICFLINS